MFRSMFKPIGTSVTRNKVFSLNPRRFFCSFSVFFSSSVLLGTNLNIFSWTLIMVIMPVFWCLWCLTHLLNFNYGYYNFKFCKCFLEKIFIIFDGAYALLIVWEFCTLNFGHIYSSPPLPLKIWPSSHTYPTSWLLFAKFTAKTSWCEALTWSVVYTCKASIPYI